jgi:hypothetical protein
MLLPLAKRAISPRGAGQKRNAPNARKGRTKVAKTVADRFAETLAAAGVRRVYGIVGDSLNGLTDGLRRQGKIEWLHGPHGAMPTPRAARREPIDAGPSAFINH